MGNNRFTFDAADLVPAAFIGSPLGLVLSAGLHNFVSVVPALCIGAVVGIAAGLAIYCSIKRG